MTRYTAAAGNLEGCSYISVANAGGVMCCKDDSTTPTVPPTSTPTPGSCDFERGMCNWIVDSTAAARFSRWRGETPSRNTGPRYDHTKKDSTGKMLFHSSVNRAGRYFLNSTVEVITLHPYTRTLHLPKN